MGSKLVFEKNVGINEEVPIEFQMKKGDQNVVGKAVFKVEKIGEVAKMGDVQAISGQTFYYVLFSFKGDVNNPVGDDVSPKLLVEPAAPQIVLVDENTLPSIGGAMGGSYDTDAAQEMTVASNINIKMNQEQATSTVSTWYTKKVEKPMFAIQYTGVGGEKKYVSINN